MPTKVYCRNCGRSYDSYDQPRKIDEVDGVDIMGVRLLCCQGFAGVQFVKKEHAAQYIQSRIEYLQRALGKLSQFKDSD